MANLKLGWHNHNFVMIWSHVKPSFILGASTYIYRKEMDHQHSLRGRQWVRFLFLVTVGALIVVVERVWHLGALRLSVVAPKSKSVVASALLQPNNLTNEIHGLTNPHDGHTNESDERPASHLAMQHDDGQHDSTRALFRRFQIQNPSSDIAYLHHCNLTRMINNATDFLVFANQSLASLFLPIMARRPATFIADDGYDEARVQLLEQYASGHGHCDFSKFRPTAGSFPFQEAQLRRVPPPSNSSWARLVFCIIAYHDANHLAALLEAIHLPHHWIVIHLERQTDAAFVTEVQTIASHYDNVVVLQFGSITYQTDQVSWINLKIMRWMQEQLDLDFDYFCSLGGSAYPLMGAVTMAARLYADTPHRVHLGRLAYGGGPRLARMQAENFGLIHSRNNNATTKKEYLKTQVRRNDTFRLRPQLQRYAKYKTNSGNQAIFDVQAVRLLLNSSEVMEMVAHFRLGCCCCIEESSWGAYVVAIGREQDLLKPGAMWQAWNCGRSAGMHNKVLSTNNESSSSCYAIYDDGGKGNKKREVEWVDGLKRELREARDRGHYFARKFTSDDTSSVDLREWVRDTLH